MTREMKIALIVGFLLVLFVTVLISDHLSKARQQRLETAVSVQPPLVPSVAMTPPSNPTNLPLTSPGPILPADSTPPPAPVEIKPTVAEAPTIPAEKPVEITLGKTGGNPNLLGKGRFATSPVRGSAALDVIADPAGPGTNVADAPKPVAPKVSGKEHVVEEGESLYRIAKDAYGDGSLWKKLVEANPGKATAEGSVKVGTTIILPSKDALLGKVEPMRVAQNVTKEVPGRKSEGATKTTPASAKGRTYVVQKGDTLGDIARKELGSSKRAKDILQQNAGTLKDPTSMQPGMVLTMPNA